MAIRSLSLRRRSFSASCCSLAYSGGKSPATCAVRTIGGRDGPAARRIADEPGRTVVHVVSRGTRTGRGCCFPVVHATSDFAVCLVLANQFSPRGLARDLLGRDGAGNGPGCTLRLRLLR